MSSIHHILAGGMLGTATILASYVQLAYVLGEFRLHFSIR